MVNWIGESRHPCLVPDLCRKAFTFSPLSIILAALFLWKVKVQFIICWALLFWMTVMFFPILCHTYWHGHIHFFLSFFFSFIFISWRLITLQYCSGFCHTLTWISHGFTCVPHPDPPSHLPLDQIPLALPSAPGPSTCLVHPTWAGDLFHPR